MSSEETKIVFSDVQGLETSRPLQIMIPKALRSKSFCPYSLLLDYIDRGTFLTKLSDSAQLSISLNNLIKE